MRLKPGKLLRTMTITALAGSLFALSACGSEGEPNTSADAQAAPPEVEDDAEAPSGEYRNAPIPAADPADSWGEDQLPQKPSNEDGLRMVIEHGVLVETATFAREFDPDGTAQCPEVSGSKDEAITCTVTYLGLDLEWEVEVKGGNYVSSYSAQAPDRVVSRSFVEDALRFDQQTEDVYCDIDEHHLTPATGDEKFNCGSLTDGEESTWELVLSRYGEASFYRI